MKAWHNIYTRINLLVLCLFSFAACVNHISEEEEIVNNGDIPLKFVANIHEVTQTRVADNSFEAGDEVGLFALVENTTMKEERYVDNFHFVHSSDGVFQSEETVYYPDDGVTLNLISYYPYQEEGVAMGESTMPVSVATNQNDPAAYTHSDFLIATQDDVLASKEALALTYNHQFFRLKISLVPGEGENVEELLSLNPTISINGFYTKVFYDFQKKAFTGYSEEQDITPRGEWEIQNGRLVGKELILIPQETTTGYQHVTLQANGKTYVSFLPSGLQLQSGKQRELEIVFVAAEDILMSEVNGEINDWEGEEVDQGVSEVYRKYVDLSRLTFEKSNVCKVLNKEGEQVAEICKEYLVAPNIDAQAIVAYPMKEDGTVNLSRGVVVQLLGQSGAVHGGSASWNTEDHSLTYTPGVLTIRDKVFILANGEVSLNMTMANEVLPVLTLDDVVRDVRGGMIHNYPLVKIGTQYWMRSNLEASFYPDGDELSELAEVTEGAVGYLQSEAGHYFYTANVALSDNFLPTHWSLPNWEDWNILNTYLKGDVSLLKSGEWIPINGAEVTPVTNYSGFNGLPVGMVVESDLEAFVSKYSGYWTLDDTNTGIAEKVFSMSSSENASVEAMSGVERKAFAIRCIRK